MTLGFLNPYNCVCINHPDYKKTSKPNYLENLSRSTGILFLDLTVFNMSNTTRRAINFQDLISFYDKREEEIKRMLRERNLPTYDLTAGKFCLMVSIEKVSPT
ncbi:hypothetical protein HanRHA438_Chr13g0591971 [Helianthus annuus]|nr:hypothetical protein HanRHA438_Chr13g0591971 [Helianthus annuus]